MSKRKAFTTGQQVEVWRRALFRWDLGVYVGTTELPGYHKVTVGGGVLEFHSRHVREPIVGDL